MRVRNVHTAMVAGLEPGEEGDRPRTPPVLLLVRGGLLEEVARVDVPTPPPPAPEDAGPAAQPSPPTDHEEENPDPAALEAELEKLLALTAKQTRAAVRAITDAELLGRWLGRESRKTVRAVLEARLEELGGSDTR